MSKTKNSLFNLGILIFSFLLMACSPQQSVSEFQANYSSEQKIAEQGSVKNRNEAFESKIDRLEIDEENSWYGKVSNWFGGLFSNELKEAAENGDAKAQFELGEKYWDKEDFEKAVYWYERSAENGYAAAQYYLGWMYDHGKGVSKDDEKAVYWFEKSAKQGDAEAQYYLGYMYRYGVSRDYEKAAYWFEKSAENGYSKAKSKLVKTQYELGWMYYYGDVGVPKDYQKALYWFEKSAENGYTEARSMLLKAQYELGVMLL